MTRTHKWFLFLVGVAVLITVINAPSLSERMKAECEREYGKQGAGAVERCVIAIMAAKIRADASQFDANEAARIKRTYDRVY